MEPKFAIGDVVRVEMSGWREEAVEDVNYAVTEIFWERGGWTFRIKPVDRPGQMWDMRERELSYI